MDLSNIPDGKEMIDTGVKTTFIQYGDTSFFRSYVSFSENFKRPSRGEVTLVKAGH